MYSYTPKLSHAFVTALTCLAFIAMGSKVQGRVLTACNLGAFIFALMTAAIMWWLFLEAANHRVEIITEWMREFAKLDEESRAAVAFTFPTVRYRMKRGEVREYFEDTNATIAQFRTFLQTSNEKYISPRRDWMTKERPAWAWEEIKGYLVSMDYILEDSAAGSHSWAWKGNAYRHLMAYWMAGRRAQNLNMEMEQA